MPIQYFIPTELYQPSFIVSRSAWENSLGCSASSISAGWCYIRDKERGNNSKRGLLEFGRLHICICRGQPTIRANAFKYS